MDPSTPKYRIVEKWTKGNPTDPATGNPFTQWLYMTYAFNSGLTASTWYRTKPWSRATAYTQYMIPWKVGEMKPEWPVISDLRTYVNIGNGDPPYPAHESHHCRGFSVLAVDGSVRWVDKVLPEQNADVGNQAYESWTYNGASISMLWDNDLLLR